MVDREVLLSHFTDKETKSKLSYLNNINHTDGKWQNLIELKSIYPKVLNLSLGYLYVTFIYPKLEQESK